MFNEKVWCSCSMKKYISTLKWRMRFRNAFATCKYWNAYFVLAFPSLTSFKRFTPCVKKAFQSIRRFGVALSDVNYLFPITCHQAFQCWRHFTVSDSPSLLFNKFSIVFKQLITNDNFIHNKMYKFTVTKLIILNSQWTLMTFLRRNFSRHCWRSNPSSHLQRDPLYLLNSKLSQLNFNGSRMVTLSMRMLDQFLHLDRLLNQCRLGHTKVFLC